MHNGWLDRASEPRLGLWKSGQLSGISLHFFKSRFHISVDFLQGLPLRRLNLCQRLDVIKYRLFCFLGFSKALKTQPSVSLDEFLCFKIMEKFVDLMFASVFISLVLLKLSINRYFEPGTWR